MVTNAFLIAVTSQFVPFEVYTRGGYNVDYQNNLGESDLPTLAGYVNWSVSPFLVDVLFNGSAFPAPSALELQLYNGSEVVTDENGNDLLYLPFVNYTCLENGGYSVPTHMGSDGITYSVFNRGELRALLRNTTFAPMLLVYDSGNANLDSPPDGAGPCFNSDALCRYVCMHVHGVVTFKQGLKHSVLMVHVHVYMYTLRCKVTDVTVSKGMLIQCVPLIPVMLS